MVCKIPEKADFIILCKVTNKPLPSIPIALPAIANIWFIQVNLSHQLLIQAKFWTEGKSSSRAESDGVGYSSISLPARLHTAILLILLTQRNKSTAANPALQITACNATRKASSVFSFSPT